MADGVIAGGLVTHSKDLSGNGKIYGIIRKDNGVTVAAVKRRVDLYKHSIYGQTGKIIASTLSRESDGYFEFLNLRITSGVYDYRVVARDWPPGASVQEAKIADWVQPAPM